jgi:hypothetical protein
MNTPQKSRIEMDAVGICFSALCAAHCAAFPALIALGSFTASLALRFHEYAAYAVAPIAFISAWRAWELHRRADIAMALVVGSGLLVLACTPLRLFAYNLGFPLPERLALAMGVSLVSVGHWGALRLTRRGALRRELRNSSTSKKRGAHKRSAPQKRYALGAAQPEYKAEGRRERIVWKELCLGGAIVGAAVSLTLAASTLASPKATALEQTDWAGGETATTYIANNAYKRISFRTLRLYSPESPPPKDVRELDGQKIEIMGFMAALMQLEDIDEFVLGSSPPMNCFCHPPGGVNELVLVEMRAGKRLPRYLSGVVSVRGTLKVNMRITPSNQYSEIMYSIVADEVL